MEKQSSASKGAASNQTLTNGTSIVVSCVERRELQLEQRFSQGFGASEYYMEGEKLEKCPDYEYTFLACKVGVVHVLLSNGDLLSVYGTDLPLRQPNTGQRISYKVPLPVEIGQRKMLTWGEATRLKEGDVFATEYPFQWQGEYLTDGVLSFPSERPSGQSAWRQLSIAAVPAQCWDLFLAGLEGKFRGDLLEYRQSFTKPKSQVQAKPQMTQRQQATQSVIRGQMWQGEEGARVHYGRNIMFELLRPGKYHYVVDNPGMGALYLFERKDDAEAFATGQIRRADAADVHTYLYHHGAWQERLAALLKL